LQNAQQKHRFFSKTSILEDKKLSMENLHYSTGKNPPTSNEYTLTALRLELLALPHAPAIQLMASHPDVAATTRVPHPYPPGAAKAFIEMSMQDAAAGRMYNHAVMEGNTLVGVAGLMQIKPAEKAELGYWIGKPYWGKGYATFAVQHLLADAFTRLKLQKVYAHVLDYNFASQKVLKKNGFLFIRQFTEYDAKWRKDILLYEYEITRQQWEKK
jgi:[ribosomal protein S5]-alanine N-acetyltransferase